MVETEISEKMNEKKKEEKAHRRTRYLLTVFVAMQVIEMVEFM